eukprot:UN00937
MKERGGERDARHTFVESLQSLMTHSVLVCHVSRGIDFIRKGSNLHFKPILNDD